MKRCWLSGARPLLILQGKRRYFRSSDPHRLIDLVEDRVRRLEREKKKLERVIPGWELLLAKSARKPKVSFFEGIQGIQQVYEDTLRQPPGSEILAYASADDVYRHVPRFIEQYIRRRVKKKIHVRGMLVDTPRARAHWQRHQHHLLKFKFIPKRFEFRPEVNIYNHKVAFMTFGEEFFGVIIESKEIYSYHKQLFELVWSQLPDKL